VTPREIKYVLAEIQAIELEAGRSVGEKSELSNIGSSATNVKCSHKNPHIQPQKFVQDQGLCQWRKELPERVLGLPQNEDQALGGETIQVGHRQMF